MDDVVRRALEVMYAHCLALPGTMWAPMGCLDAPLESLEVSPASAVTPKSCVCASCTSAAQMAYL